VLLVNRLLFRDIGAGCWTRFYHIVLLFVFVFFVHHAHLSDSLYHSSVQCIKYNITGGIGTIYSFILCFSRSRLEFELTIDQTLDLLRVSCSNHHHHYATSTRLQHIQVASVVHGLDFKLSSRTRYHTLSTSPKVPCSHGGPGDPSLLDVLIVIGT